MRWGKERIRSRIITLENETVFFLIFLFSCFSFIGSNRKYQGIILERCRYFLRRKLRYGYDCLFSRRNTRVANGHPAAWNLEDHPLFGRVSGSNFACWFSTHLVRSCISSSDKLHISILIPAQSSQLLPLSVRRIPSSLRAILHLQFLYGWATFKLYMYIQANKLFRYIPYIRLVTSILVQCYSVFLIFICCFTLMGA